MNSNVNFNYKKILISGSSGSLGRIIADHFARNEIPVVGVDIVHNNPLPDDEYFTFYCASIADKNRMKKIFSREKPTNVIHLACSYNKVRDPYAEYENDVLGTKNILKVANLTKSVEKFIFFSSTSIYGAWPDNYRWMPETKKVRPGNYRYALNKKKIENVLNKYRESCNVKITILRVCTVVGPHYNKNGSAVSILIKFPFMLRISRFCEIQLLHQEDLLSMMDLVIDDPNVRGTYNIAPNDYATVQELVPDKPFYPVPLRLIKFIFGILWRTRMINLPPACINTTRYGIVADPSKFLQRYNYKIRFSTVEAFNDTVMNNQLD